MSPYYKISTHAKPRAPKDSLEVKGKSEFGRWPKPSRSRPRKLSARGANRDRVMLKRTLRPRICRVSKNPQTIEAPSYRKTRRESDK